MYAVASGAVAAVVALAVAAIAAGQPALGAACALLVVVASLEASGRVARRHPAVAQADYVPIPTPVSAWFALYVLVLVLVICDYRGFFRLGGDARYVIALPALLLAPAGLRAVARMRSLVAWPDLPLVLLIGYGLIGSVVARVFHLTPAGGLSLLMPIWFALAHTVVPPMRLREDQARKISTALIAALWLYALLHTASALPQGQLLVPGYNYTHEKAFYLTTLVCALLLRRRWTLLFAVLGCIVLIYASYPAATYPLTAAVAGLTLLATYRPLARPALAGATLTAAVVAYGVLTRLTELSTLAGNYLVSVGKTDNTETRVELWSQALQEVQRKPLFGHFWHGDLTGQTQIRGVIAKVPIHNDYLQIALGGGLVALALFIWWIAATNYFTVTRILSRSQEQRHIRRLEITLLVLINSGAAVALFNPVFFNVGSSSAMFLSYASLRVVSRLADHSAPAHMTDEAQ